MTEGVFPAAAPQPSSSASAASPAAAGLAPVATVVAPIVRRPVLASWPDFRAMMRIALVPIAVWLLMSIVIGITFGHAFSTHLGKEFGAQQLKDFYLDDIDVIGAWLASIAMFASLIGGLGFQLVGAGADGAPSGIALAVAPIGTLAVLAWVTRFATRRVFRRRPPFSVLDLFLRVTLIAALASILIYAISTLAIMVVANSGNAPAIAPAGTLADTTLKGVTGASPMPSGLLFVLFPTLWIGAAAGVFSLAPARAFVSAPLMRFVGDCVASVWAWIAPIGVAIRAYVFAVFAFSVVFVIGAAVWLIAASPAVNDADHPDAGAVLMAVPTLLAMGVNAVLTLAVAFTGTMMDFGTANGTVARYALWHSDGWAIVAGFLALTVPVLIAGVRVRIRKRETNPAQLLVSALVLWGIAVAGAILAAPAITRTTGPAGVSSLNSSSLSSFSDLSSLMGGQTTAHLMPDLTQAVLVGGLLAILAMMAGFAIGGIFIRPPRVAAPAVPFVDAPVAVTAPQVTTASAATTPQATASHRASAPPGSPSEPPTA